MTIRATSDQPVTGARPASAKPRKRRKTSHLKKIPPVLQQREAIREKCREVAARLDKTHPLNKDEMEQVARAILDEVGESEAYVGWAMVILASEFWRDQVAAIPPSRRLLLLPHCLKPTVGCPAEYNEYGLDCGSCKACSIADFRGLAENKEYRVLVAEGSPIVMNIIVNGYVDAIVGVACLNVLEKAIDKILLAGIPCMAVPLLSSDCRSTTVDEAWVRDMVNVSRSTSDSPRPVEQTSSFVHLMRAASGMFDPDELDRLVPRRRGGPRLAQVNGQGIAGLDPLAATEAVAYDFLSKGGKHARPFITLAIYDALTGGKGTAADGAEHVSRFSDSVRRTAMAIETFHKASLVHDDIEDDDPYRYGEETLHRRYGTATAINVGDFLIGLGYRLVSREAGTLGPDVAADILDYLADAHARLAEGQGAELVWRDSTDKILKPIDALAIYALKTSPAFEAALYAGVRLAGPADDYIEPIKQFSRCLGVAFQIINDLKDWHGDEENKLARATDLLAGRPTVLWAVAVNDSEAVRDKLLQLAQDCEAPREERIAQSLELFQSAGAFDVAHRLADKYEQRAYAIASEVEPAALRRLFRYLVDTVLERPTESTSPPFPMVEAFDVGALSRS